jgi:Cft2 family RNA processing exonuclease
MFVYEKDILINDIDLWLDPKRVRDFGFISHAHGDHIARHKNIICTHPTGYFIKKRLKNPNFIALSYNQFFKIKNTLITLHPAGHILGSAQIQIKSKDTSLVYTGDFRIRPAKTVEPFEFVKPDILIMESTFGLPHYKVPPREQTEDELIDLCRSLLKHGKVPVVLAYSLGKGQEALKILTEAGLPVAVEYHILRYVSIYEKYGVKFGEFEKFKRSEFRGKGKVLLMPVQERSKSYLKNLPGAYTIYLSGWGIDQSAAQKFGVDKVLPLSDHADFDELIELVEKTKPAQIYVTHGFDQFVNILRNAGFNAYNLEEKGRSGK